MESILIIDDNEEFVDDLVHVLRRSFQCETADTGEKGLEQIERQEPDLVLLDYDLGAGASGLEILEKLVARHPEVPVIMVTKESGVRTVVRAMKSGAFDYLVKNTSRDEFIEVIRKGLSLRQVKQENTILRRALKQSLGRLVGDSEAIRTLKRQIQEAASTELTVTITGETGTGKTLIARLIHEGSERGRQPFIDVNVSAIEKELFNSEVYGHEKGSFTGAVGTKKGLVELAHRGTLFLDEIGDLEPAAQIKLLTTIESGMIRRVGALSDVQVDFRLVAATHQDLEKHIATGSFRQDLYYRLNQLRIRIPPLRERRDDIPVLLRYFIHKYFPARDTVEIPDETIAALQAQSWNGNVREFESAVQLAMVRLKEDRLRPEHFTLGGAVSVAADQADFGALTDQPFTDARDRLLDRLRMAYLDRYLGSGSMKEVADRIGISREVLHRWVKDRAAG